MRPTPGSERSSRIWGSARRGTARSGRASGQGRGFSSSLRRLQFGPDPWTLPRDQKTPRGSLGVRRGANGSTARASPRSQFIDGKKLFLSTGRESRTYRDGWRPTLTGHRGGLVRGRRLGRTCLPEDRPAAGRARASASLRLCGSTVTFSEAPWLSDGRTRGETFCSRSERVRNAKPW